MNLKVTPCGTVIILNLDSALKPIKESCKLAQRFISGSLTIFRMFVLFPKNPNRLPTARMRSAIIFKSVVASDTIRRLIAHHIGKDDTQSHRTL